MLIALCYCQKDRVQAERLAGWLIELGPFPRHSFLIFRHEAADPIAAFESFASGETVIRDDVFNSWPQSANHAFKKVGKEIEYGARKPFLWIEPDAVPLHGKAFDEIEDEYARLGKPFLGDIINDGPGFVPHMSGIGVYPASISNFAGDIYFADSNPWDIFAAAQILPQAAQSEYIFHRWKAPPIESLDQLNEHVLKERPKCALFHSDKSGNLIALLRGHALPVADAAPHHLSKVEIADLTIPPSIYEKPSDPDLGLIKPWENFEETMAEIKRLAKRLGAFCSAGGTQQGSRTRSVLISLHDEKVIKLRYRKKPRSGKPRKKGNWRKPKGEFSRTRDQARLERRKEREREERVSFPDQDCLFCRSPRAICTCPPGTF